MGLTKKNSETIASVVEDVIFKPTYEQVQVKAAFWTKFSSSPLIDTNKITLSHVQKFVTDSRIDRWWQIFGFREWFLNEDEFQERALSLAYLALSSLENVLIDPDCNPNAKVNAAKLIIEVANKMPQRWQKTMYIDDHIQKMDKAQLEQFLRQQNLGLVDDKKTKEDSKDS